MAIPQKPEQFQHLALLPPDALLRRRSRIAQIIKRLEEERKEIDAELQGSYSDAELRRGIQCGGGWILKQCHRTFWNYDQQTRDEIRAIQQAAQRSGNAIPQVTAYLQASCMKRKEPSE